VVRVERQCWEQTSHGPAVPRHPALIMLTYWHNANPLAYSRRPHAKELLREAVEHVPEDATIEDVMERLYFLAKVARGIDAADNGDVEPHEEIEREFLSEE
jgi:predicted transcriptional regulator